MIWRPWSRGRAAEPVHDGEPQAFLRDGLDEDALDPGRVQLPKDREEVTGIGAEVARHGLHAEPGALEGDGALGHQSHWPPGLDPGGDDPLSCPRFNDDDLGAGGIVAVAEPRRASRGLLVVAAEHADLAQAVRQLLERHAARPQQHGRLGGHVEDGRFHADRLADGAAMGRPLASISARATGWDGTRAATVSSPPVVMSGTVAARGRTKVRGPGQKRAAASRARGGTRAAMLSSAAASARWTINGLPRGRSLASKMRATAASDRASAPSP